MQIPRSVLTDDLTVYAPDAASGYAGEYADPRTIRHVRFIGRAGLASCGFALAEGASGRILIDAANSEGACGVPVGAKVEVSGVPGAMQVLTCTPCKAGGRVHHWEVDVS